MRNTDLEGYKNFKKPKYSMEIGLTGSKIILVIVEALTVEEIEAILTQKSPTGYLRRYGVID
ncbi:hypothetical protein [Flagellimonas sp. 2504JD4-2]